jgi:hypothetical protein
MNCRLTLPLDLLAVDSELYVLQLPSSLRIELTESTESSLPIESVFFQGNSLRGIENRTIRR